MSISYAVMAYLVIVWCVNCMITYVVILSVTSISKKVARAYEALEGARAELFDALLEAAGGRRNTSTCYVMLCDCRVWPWYVVIWNGRVRCGVVVRGTALILIIAFTCTGLYSNFGSHGCRLMLAFNGQRRH